MEDHYSQLLGLVAPWKIRDVALDVEHATLDIHVVESDGHILWNNAEIS